MLKNLFNKLKSENSSTLKNEEPNTETNQGLKYSFYNTSNLSLKDKYISEKKQFQLSLKIIHQSQVSQAIVKGQIKQVRYWTTEQMPDIFITVLSCPISHYNILPHSQRKVKQIELKRDKFPEYLNFMKLLMQKELPTYNHLLINHYPKGIGIMHHFDGPMYKDKVVVLSLGGPAVISFQENYKKESKSMQILLQHKSIHIFERDAYQKYLHGIQNSKVDAITFKISPFQNKNQQKKNDIVLLKSKDSQKEVYKVGQSSVKNFNSIKSIHRVIEKYLQRLVFKKTSSWQENFCIDFDQFEGYAGIKGCFIYIKSNFPKQEQYLIEETTITPKSYHWKMEIQRQQRISITIRQQFSTQNA